jgi:hypothetical protein
MAAGPAVVYEGNFLFFNQQLSLMADVDNFYVFEK